MIALRRLACHLRGHAWMICDCYVTADVKKRTNPFICARCHTRAKDNT